MSPLLMIYWTSLVRVPLLVTLVAITGDLFKRIHFRTHSQLVLGADIWCLLNRRKWAMRILLECFLVASKTKT